MSDFKPTAEEKEILGETCINCGSTISPQYHHVVPLSLGGNNVLSNIVCLCSNCHQILHFGKSNGLSHSELTKKGIERARLEGKQIGSKKGEKKITQKFLQAKNIILAQSKTFGGTLTDTEVIALCNISRKTYYKYKTLLKQQKEIK